MNSNKIKYYGDGITSYQVEVVEKVGTDSIGGGDLVKVKVTEGQNITDKKKVKIESLTHNIYELWDDNPY